MRPFALVLIAACGAWGCLADTRYEPGAGGLVDAQPDLDNPAVGLLRIGPAQCTGTLVAPRVVVTVKHCFPTGPLPPIHFFLGETGQTAAGTGVAIFHRTPPEGYKRQSHDIVAIVLDADAPVVPMPPRRAPMTRDLEDHRVTLVGYGVTADGATDDGVRRSGPALIDSIALGRFETRREDGQSTSCNGDSGGAVVLDGELAGVIIGSVWGNCRRIAIHTRVDMYPDVLDAALADAARRAAAETPVAPAPEPSSEPQPEEPEAGHEDDGVDTNALVCEEGYCVPGDGWCDDGLDCCDEDADCDAAPVEPAACDCDLTWGCDECWCEPPSECP